MLLVILSNSETQILTVKSYDVRKVIINKIRYSMTQLVHILIKVSQRKTSDRELSLSENKEMKGSFVSTARPPYLKALETFDIYTRNNSPKNYYTTVLKFTYNV